MHDLIRRYGASPHIRTATQLKITSISRLQRNAVVCRSCCLLRPKASGDNYSQLTISPASNSSFSKLWDIKSCFTHQNVRKMRLKTSTGISISMGGEPYPTIFTAPSYRSSHLSKKFDTEALEPRVFLYGGIQGEFEPPRYVRLHAVHMPLASNSRPFASYTSPPHSCAISKHSSLRRGPPSMKLIHFYE